MATYPNKLIEPEFVATDQDPMFTGGPQLHVRFRTEDESPPVGEPTTLAIMVVGKKGAIKGWVELSRNDTARLRDYLTEKLG